MNGKKLIERVKGLLLNPDETWQEIKRDPAGVPELARDYVLKLALVPAVSHFLGWWAVVGFWTSLTRALLLYALAVAAVWVLARVIGLIAPQFDAVENETQSFKLAVFTLTPYFISGVFYLIPPLMVFVLVGGLFGAFLLYRGLPLLQEVPPDRAASYTLLVSVAQFLIFVIIGRLTGGVLSWH